jgi:cytochrome c-type biogenesis protein CcmH
VRGVVLAVAMLLAVAASALGAEPRFTMDEIEREVMCPVCGTRLDLSHVPAANQIRTFIASKQAEGWTKDEVKAALVAQFGERILATTPTSGSGLIAWLVPALAGAGGIAVAAALVLMWRRRPGDRVAPAQPALDDEAARKVAAALRDYDA